MVSQQVRGLRLRIACGVGLVALGGLTGCVERRYTIRSNPPGAQVIVNGEEIGPTPVSRSFTYHGNREITLMHDGFATKTLVQLIEAPWWDNHFTEFFTENLIPFTFRDEHEFNYEMKPASVPDTNDLLGRGQNLRAQAQAIPPPRPTGIFGWLGFP